MMTEKEKMLAGEWFNPSDPELKADAARSQQLTRLFNATTEEQKDYRRQLLKKLFGSTGEKLTIEPPFHCDYGYNIHVGEKFYANFDCIILDVGEVRIGKNCLLAPRVCIFTVGHPIDPELRSTGVEAAKPVIIGDNVWIGGNTVINPGVTIGDNVVIGSGSVVTKDIPSNVVAVGNPCKPIKTLK
ncbi:MAG: sugar O-acetyltransferase [Clostridia bacterium]|nr:sugar O-acetyltransferase [Clostridia bacterium]